VISHIDPQHPPGSVVEIQDKGDIEGTEAVQVGEIEPARRMGEAHLAHRAGGIRPPWVNPPVGRLEVGGQVAEAASSASR
jgi:hypothetical protein